MRVLECNWNGTYAHCHIENGRFHGDGCRDSYGGNLLGSGSLPAVSGFGASFTARERADPPFDRWNAGPNVAVGLDGRDRSDAKRLVPVCVCFALPRDSYPLPLLRSDRASPRFSLF